MHINRIARRLARRLFKRTALWLNARAYRSSEYEVVRMLQLREDAGILAMVERRNQVKLEMRRREIEAW